MFARPIRRMTLLALALAASLLVFGCGDSEDDDGNGGGGGGAGGTSCAAYCGHLYDICAQEMANTGVTEQQCTQACESDPDGVSATGNPECVMAASTCDELRACDSDGSVGDGSVGGGGGGGSTAECDAFCTNGGELCGMTPTDVEDCKTTCPDSGLTSAQLQCGAGATTCQEWGSCVQL